jgi:ParB family transcriptional regulator, chromosome partitioning protein
MQHKIEAIPLAKIDTNDETYRITTDVSTADLEASMKRVGLLKPPVLREKASGYSPVSGFRRICACRKLGWESVDSRVLDTEIPAIQCVMIAICENSLQRTLNLIETSRALNMLSAHVADVPTRLRITPDLGLTDNPRYMARVASLSKLPMNIQDAVADESISLSMALALACIEPADAMMLCDLFCDLKIGLNKQQEILTRVKEISARENIAINALLNSQDFYSIRTNPDFDRTQKRQAIRNYLKHRRCPNIAESEARFEAQKRRLNLSRSVKLEPPPYFEGTDYTFKIQFSNLSELKTHTATLCDLVDNPILKKIMSRS